MSGIKTKIKILFFILFLTSIPLTAQTQLSNLNTSWTQVLGGKFLTKPVLTPYGFIGITDGRSIESISNSGKIIWEQNFSVNSQTILNVISKDFLLCVSNGGKRITLFNPSGVPLWNKLLDYEICFQAYEGRDGRFFVRGKNVISCFSINGICKWKLDTENQSDLPLQELEDGSLILFLKELVNGKTRALRITPFGEIIEDIIFAGEILSATTSEKGIFLTFSDGSSGLFGLSREKGKSKADNKYVLDPDVFGKNTSSFFVSDNRNPSGVFVTSNKKDVRLFYLNTENGSIIWDLLIPDFDIKKIVETKLSDEGFFICDNRQGFFINLSGTLQWNCLLPENQNRNKWNYALFTENNTLVICKDNWSIEGYKVEQHTGIKTSDIKYDYYLDYLTIDSSVYSTIYQDRMDKEITGKERYKKLEAGFYGKKEIVYTSDILSACQAYMKTNKESSFGSREGPSVFMANTSDMESLLNQLPLYGTRYTTNLTAKLLGQETNNSILNCIVTGIKKDGYDPDGEILEALRLLSAKTPARNTVLQRNICDAVYSICRFMGRPAFNKNGKDILKDLMYPSNSSTVRTKARDTMEKIAALEN